MNSSINAEDIREKFVEADADHSGFLTMDEMFNIF